MKTIIVVIFVVIFSEDAVLGTDYCQAGLCRPNLKHIGCGANDNFGSSCPSIKSLTPMTADLQAYLLKKHNQARSQVAVGNLTGFLSAKQMLEMTWDVELAKLAEYNVKSCVFGADQCRNTDKYKLAGQNIALYIANPNAFKSVDSIFGFWFDENRNCNMNYINKNGPSSTGTIGHFTQIVLDNAYKLGCAMTIFGKSSNDLYVYLVCNYSLTNISNQPVYVTGKPCSACTKGCSKTYSGLCDSSNLI